MTKARKWGAWVSPADIQGAVSNVAKQRSRAGKKANIARNAKLGPEGRKRAAQRGVAALNARWARMSPEERTEVARRAALKRYAKMSPEERAEFSRRGVVAANMVRSTMSPEERSAAAQRASNARWERVRAERGEVCNG